MPYKLLQALATLGLQLAEKEGSDLKENLDSVKIWGDKGPGLDYPRSKIIQGREKVCNQLRAGSLWEDRKCAPRDIVVQGLHRHSNSCMRELLEQQQERDSNKSQVPLI